MKTPTTLIIMDGYGLEEAGCGNAIQNAATPNLDKLFAENPCCKLAASALAGVPAEKLRKCVIAYEPVWAIGTGKTATAEQAGEVCQEIRTVIRKMYGAHVARSVTIQYGGSMNAKNAAELLAQPDVDGGLIGGASLKPADFVQIINAANQE